jgi:Flp pilus assembly protein TadD
LERGIAEISAGRAEAAVAPLQRAITANPRNGAAFTYLARAYDLAGDLPRAHKYFDLALEVEPADRLALSWGGQVDIRQGNLAAAEAKLGRLAELCARGCPSLDELKVALDTRGLPVTAGGAAGPGAEDTRLVLDPASDGAVAR